MRDEKQPVYTTAVSDTPVGSCLHGVHVVGHHEPKIQYAIDRYTNEANRLTNVLDRRLAEVEYVAGEYSIADIAIFPWMRGADTRGINMAEYPTVQRWFDAISKRPAVQRGVKVLADASAAAPLDDKARDIMFGKTQFQRR